MLRVEARARLGALGLDVALSVDAGRCLALAGPSGAGKTSILRVAAGLLAALGPQGVFGGAIGDRLVLTTAGVVVALTFVSAPFYMRQAQASFEALDPTWLDASRTLGASEARTFLRIAIPGAGAGIAAGLALAWGRALGEFGATLMFAGSFRGITQTVPLAIYERFSTDFTGALGLSAVLVCVSAGILLAVKFAFRAAA